MKNGRYPLLLSVVLCILVSARSLLADSFTPGCTVPFSSIAQTHPIDAQCGIEGDFTANPANDTPPHRAQNHAKNNLCATGTASRVTAFTMKQLQQTTEQMKQKHKLKFGGENVLPDDRTVLGNLRTTSDGNLIGEGSVVQLVGFVLKAKNQSKESVNCTLSNQHADNDIHIALGGTKNTAPCDSITAELTPHLRPDAWTVAALSALTHPVRITGQLFFDASHVTCRNGAPVGTNPARVSLWEVHPVYGIDVCSKASIANCRFDDSSVWTPLNQFTP